MIIQNQIKYFQIKSNILLDKAQIVYMRNLFFNPRRNQLYNKDMANDVITIL